MVESVAAAADWYTSFADGCTAAAAADWYSSCMNCCCCSLHLEESAFEESAFAGDAVDIVDVAVAASNMMSCQGLPDCNHHCDSIGMSNVVVVAAAAVHALLCFGVILDPAVVGRTSKSHLCLCHTHKGCLLGSSALC